MNEAIKATMDISGFTRNFQQLGDVIEQDSVEFVRDETARLSEECATQLSRRNKKSKFEHTISRDVRAVFAKAPINPFCDHRKDGTHGMTWLYASPDALYGVKTFRDWRDQNPETMKTMFRKVTLPPLRFKVLGTMNTFRFDRKTHQGRRQHVIELQRLVVSRGAYKAFLAGIYALRGRLEASFADTANKLRGKVKVLAAIRKHFPSATNIHRPEGLSDRAYPRMEFGSEAPGVENFEREIENAIQVRARKMQDRYNLIISGFSKDVSNNIRPRNRVKTIALIE